MHRSPTYMNAGRLGRQNGERRYKREGGRERRRAVLRFGREIRRRDTARRNEDRTWKKCLLSCLPCSHAPSSISSSPHLLLPSFLPPFSLILTRRQSHVGTWGSKHLASPLRPAVLRRA